MKCTKSVIFTNTSKVKVRFNNTFPLALYSLLPLFLVTDSVLREAERLRVYDEKLQKMVFSDRIAVSLADLWSRSNYFYFPLIAGLLLAVIPIVRMILDRRGSNSQWTFLRLPHGRVRYWLRLIIFSFGVLLLYTLGQLLVHLAGYGIYCAAIPEANRPAELFRLNITLPETGYSFQVHYLLSCMAAMILPLLLTSIVVLMIYCYQRCFHRIFYWVFRKKNEKEKKEMLEFQNVTMTYALHPVLKDISFQIGPGEIIGLLGENGAGKTTIIKLILGLINKRSGEILLDGHPITENDMERFAFATSEHSHFPKLTAREHAIFYAEQFPKFKLERFDALMEFFKLPYDTKMCHLSMGQKNQIETVLALSQGADFILLDEPFASNDIFIREDFYKLVLGLLESNETILLSTHLIEEVQNFVSRVIILKSKYIVADVTTEEVEEKGLTLKEYISKMYQRDTGRVTEFLSK